MHIIKRLFRDKRGNVLVQAAIAVPILLGLFMGIVLFCNAYRYKIIMSMAAKEGARMYAFSMGDSSKAIQKSNEELAIGGISANVSQSGAGIKITKPYGIGIPLFGKYLLNLETEHKFKEEIVERYYEKGWN
ncbi:TadE/TadG family type IV pilus assembly protein [Wukongibacter baidiensis]